VTRETPLPGDTQASQPAKETITMTTLRTSTPAAALDHPRTAAAFRKIKLLVGGYLGISALAVVAIVLLRHHSAEVNSAVWTHGIIVAASALVAFAVTVRAARGSRGAYRRLRVISAVVVVTIGVIIALPGSFPLWMKAEQGVAGLLMIGVAVLVNGSHLRSLFAAK
jgi:hypothetical protein